MLSRSWVSVVFAIGAALPFDALPSDRPLEKTIQHAAILQKASTTLGAPRPCRAFHSPPSDKAFNYMIHACVGDCNVSFYATGLPIGSKLESFGGSSLLRCTFQSGLNLVGAGAPEIPPP